MHIILVEFYQMPFLHLLRWSCCFCLLFWWYNVSHWLICHPCDTGMNPTWLWCMIFFMCCWILFAKIYRDFLHLYSSKILAYNFFFGSNLWFQWWWIHRMSLGVFFLQSFGKCLLCVFGRTCLWIHLILDFCL